MAELRKHDRHGVPALVGWAGAICQLVSGLSILAALLVYAGGILGLTDHPIDWNEQRWLWGVGAVFGVLAWKITRYERNVTARFYGLDDEGQ